MNKLSITSSATLILILLTNFVFAQAKLDARIDSLFQSYLEKGLVGSVLVAKDNQVVLKKAYGYSNNETKEQNTPATLFNVASIGKQFTMFAILQLEEAGALKTTDYLSKYIGHFHDERDSITLHHLLCHTSGLVKSGSNLDYKTRDGFIESVKKAETESVPGAKYRYTNAGYSMLAAVVERVAQMPFEKYLHLKLFKPLGMNSTGYPWEDRIPKKRLATGYNSKHQPVPAEEDVWAARGPGNIATTMEDLYKWIQIYDNEKFMSATNKEKILKDYHPGNESYAWTKLKSKHNTPFYSKGGGRDDFESRLLWWPEDKVVVIFSLNNDYNLARELQATLVNIMK
jgi:CubicO group peptidase (beta-lactamase class C family)